MVANPSRRREHLATPEGKRWVERLRDSPTAHDAALALVAIAGFSTVLRIVLTTAARAPVAFSDELGYEKLAESIGRTGHLALFNQRGLSYSPLYPAVLAPIYALGASAPTAYTLIKIVNAFLISLSVFPTYKIARFVLPRRASLIVAALSTAAPLMFYSSFSMSENLAYPVCLTAIWAMLATIRAPSLRNDALLLGSILVASATRAQLVVLVPAALTAVVLTAAPEGEPGEDLPHRIAAAVNRHRLLFGAVVGALLVAGVGALAGKGIFSIFGRYAEVGRNGLPDLGHFLNLLVRHLAGLDLAVGVVPFIAAIVAAVAFARGGLGGNALPFAAVAVSVTTWLLLEVAFDAALFDGHGGDVPRIHERFLIYVVPFFLVALLATVRIPETMAPVHLYLAAGAMAALLLVAIPFHTVVNQASGMETFGLQPFAHPRGGRLVAIPLAAAVAVAGATVLGLLYAQVRRQSRAIVILVLIPLVLISGQVLSHAAATSRFTRSLLPARANWVDAAKPSGTVVLITGAADPIAALETAYSNLSIARLYYICRPAAGSEFGERQATIDAKGRLHDESGYIQATYAVGPTGLGISGYVVARNTRGRQVLVALLDGRLRVPPSRRTAALDCGH